jgi:hypothetical protein
MEAFKHGHQLASKPPDDEPESLKEEDEPESL